MTIIIDFTKWLINEITDELIKLIIYKNRQEINSMLIYKCMSYTMLHIFRNDYDELLTVYN